jgi:transposase-like protein
MLRMTQEISNTYPLCVRCGSTMHFSCVEPEPNRPGFLHQVYECTKCRNTQSVVIRKD